MTGFRFEFGKEDFFSDDEAAEVIAMDFEETFKGIDSAQKQKQFSTGQITEIVARGHEEKFGGVKTVESTRPEKIMKKDSKKKAKGKGKKDEVEICGARVGEYSDFETVSRYSYIESERVNVKQKVEVNEGVQIIYDNLPQEKSRKRRKVTVGRALRSPYTDKFRSNEKDKQHEVVGTKKIYSKVRGEMCLDDFAQLGEDNIVEFALHALLSFLNEGKSRKRSVRLNKWYTTVTDVIPEPFRYTVATVDSKKFFYNLYTPNEWLSDEHMDTIFYHLWKNGKYCDDIKYSFMTTDFLFHTRIHTAVQAVEKLDLNSNLTTQLSIKDHVASRMIGRGILCGKHWGEVDHVLFPMHTGGNHWILGRFEVLSRTLFIYDSMMKRRSYRDTKQTANEYAKVIPYYLHAFSVFVAREDVDSSPAYLMDDPLAPLKVVHVKDIPQQQDSDCGVFVATLAEYLIEQRLMPDNVDIVAARKRLVVSLFWHGKLKNANGQESDEEYTRP